eukprot:g1169.t1
MDTELPHEITGSSYDDELAKLEAEELASVRARASLRLNNRIVQSAKVCYEKKQGEQQGDEAAADFPDELWMLVGRFVGGGEATRAVPLHERIPRNLIELRVSLGEDEDDDHVLLPSAYVEAGENTSSAVGNDWEQGPLPPDACFAIWGSLWFRLHKKAHNILNDTALRGSPAETFIGEVCTPTPLTFHPSKLPDLRLQLGSLVASPSYMHSQEGEVFLPRWPGWFFHRLGEPGNDTENTFSLHFILPARSCNRLRGAKTLIGRVALQVALTGVVARRLNSEYELVVSEAFQETAWEPTERNPLERKWYTNQQKLFEFIALNSARCDTATLACVEVQRAFSNAWHTAVRGLGHRSDTIQAAKVLGVPVVLDGVIETRLLANGYQNTN